MRTIKRRHKILVASTVILILFGALFIQNRLTDIDQKLSELQYIQSEVQNVSHSLNDISYGIDMRLDEFMQEQMWIQEKTFDIVDIDMENQTADVKLNWVLRDIKQGETVTLFIRDEDETDWTEHDVTTLSGLNYTFEQTLPITNHYEIQMVATNESGQRGEKLLDLNIKEILDSRVTIDGHVHEMGVDNRYDLFIMIHTNAGMAMDEWMAEQEQPIENLDIKSANAYVYVDGEVFEEIDMLKENTNRGNRQHYEYFGAVELEEPTRDVEVQVMVEDALGWTYEHTINVY